MKKQVKFVLLSFGFLFFIGALVLFHNQLKNLNYIDIINALKAVSVFKIVIALILALLYYVILGGYDIIAFKYIGSNISLKPRYILFVCFISNILANNTGYSMLFGGSVRYRLYSAYKVSIVDVTKALFFSSATTWLGLLTIGAFVFTLSPTSLSLILNLNFSTRTVGIFSIVILFSYIFLSILHLGPIKIFKWNIIFPNMKIVASQIFLATCDWLVASLTLYVLMPLGYVSYFGLLKVFLITQFAVIISQVPGGIGVFETFIILLLPNVASNPLAISALLIYRLVFYIVPLLIALVMFVFFEAMKIINKFNERAKIFAKTISSVIVHGIALSAFLASVIVMFSTATAFNVTKFIDVFHLWVVDLAHFMLNIAVVMLLFISMALQFRIKNAWTIACILISVIIALMVTVGASLLLFLWFVALLITLLVFKKYFYREISIFNTSFNTLWFSAVVGVFVFFAWLDFL
jgi:phosphatidylglycerol lysyltransferase